MVSHGNSRIVGDTGPAQDPEAFLRFLRSVFGGVDRPGNPNVQVACPWCEASKGPGYHKRKLSVKVENHLVNCWVCGYRSRNLLHLVRTWYRSETARYLDLVPCGLPTQGGRCTWAQSEDFSEDSTVPVSLPEPWILLAENTRSQDPMVRKALAYLRARGVTSKDDLWWWKFGVAPDDLPWRVVLPSFDAVGNLSFWTGRSVLDTARIPYWNSQVPKTGVVWNEWAVDWSVPLVLTEGPFDLVACGRDTNATIVLGSKLGDKHLLFARILQHQTPVILALDRDMHQETVKIGARLHRLGIPVSVMDLPPGVKDLGALQGHTRTTVKSLIASAKPYEPLRTKVRLVLQDLT